MSVNKQSDCSLLCRLLVSRELIRHYWRTVSRGIMGRAGAKHVFCGAAVTYPAPSSAWPDCWDQVLLRTPYTDRACTSVGWEVLLPPYRIQYVGLTEGSGYGSLLVAHCR